MARQGVLVAAAVTAAGASEPKTYARGFVRGPRDANAPVPVATLTPEMRARAPAALDWSTQGAVTEVKDQGQCGSCWAFSATEGIESGVFMATGQLPRLSTQQIISCDKKEADGGGCDGGDLPGAFAYVMEAGGLDSDADYPDTSHSSGSTGRCTWSGEKVAQVTDWKYAVTPCAKSEQAQGGACDQQDEDGLKAALSEFGPLSVCINANSWDFYQGGVLRGACSGAWDQLDHCVQLVGYDSTASTPYWKLKNSWGSYWGEGGYIRLPMGENACGVADEATYVVATTVGPTPPTPAPTPRPTPAPTPGPTPPAPTPPAPSPGPVPHNCDDESIGDEATCEGYLDLTSGEPCQWCYLSGLGFGYCVTAAEGTQGCNGAAGLAV